MTNTAYLYLRSDVLRFLEKHPKVVQEFEETKKRKLDRKLKKDAKKKKMDEEKTGSGTE
jgi:hypothetical protein